MRMRRGWVQGVQGVRWVLVFAAVATLGRGVAFAQSPTVTAVRVVKPPTIDGRLDDPAWTGAAHITQFGQRRPLDGAPATERTDVYVAYASDPQFLSFMRQALCEPVTLPTG